MSSRLRIIATVLLLLFGAAGSHPAPASAGTIDDESRFVTLVNQLRQSEGLAPLEVHTELVGPSRDWAAHLSRVGELEHADDLSTGVTVHWTKLGENVGVAPQGEVEALFEAFVTSPAHYQNLVDPAFGYLGVGVVHDEEGRMWTTHRFMAVGGATTATTSSPATAPAPPTVPTTPTAAAALDSVDDRGRPPTPEIVPLDQVAVAAALRDLSSAGV